MLLHNVGYMWVSGNGGILKKRHKKHYQKGVPKMVKMVDEEIAKSFGDPNMTPIL